MIRTENLYDLFDVNDRTEEHTFTFDLQTYAMNLYSASNKGDTNVDITITERALSNNQDYSEMVQAKFDWKTVAESSPVVYPADPDPNNAVIALQPQRIRLFRVQYQAKQEEPAAAELDFFLQE